MRPALGGDLGQPVVDPAFQFPDLGGGEDGLDAGHLIANSHDPVAVCVDIADARGVELGGEGEPFDLTALQPGLLDRPQVSGLTVADGSTQRLIFGAMVTVSSAQVVVSEHPDRYPRPRGRRVVPAPLLLSLDAFDPASRVFANPAIDRYVTHEPRILLELAVCR